MTTPSQGTAKPNVQRRRLRFLSSIACISLGSRVIAGTALVSAQPLLVAGLVLLIAGFAANTRVQVELAGSADGPTQPS